MVTRKVIQYLTLIDDFENYDRSVSNLNRNLFAIIRNFIAIKTSHIYY
jgi:tRNA A37 threonylcarbamoyladenosine dehydratase